MASNVLYPSGSGHLLKGDFHLCTNTAGLLSSSYASLISSSYTYHTAHEFYSGAAAAAPPLYRDLPGAHIVGTAGVLGSVTCAIGTLDASDVTFSSVAAGSTVNHLVVWQTGTAGVRDFLLAHFDTGSGGTGININTNGGDITIQWNASGILALSGGC